MIEQGIFKRTELLVGKTVMDAIENASVIVFGVGGVGSWCVDSVVWLAVKSDVWSGSNEFVQFLRGDKCASVEF